MRSVLAVVVAGGLKLREMVPPPIKAGYVLAKPLATVLTPLDGAAARGYVPYVYGKVAGSAGLIRVLELGYGVGGFNVGEEAIVAPKCFVDLATRADGTLAELLSIPSECLLPAPRGIDSLLGAKVSLLAHVPSILRRISGSTLLVAGCGFEALSLAYSAMGLLRVEAMCSSEVGLQRASRLGIRSYLWEEAGGSYDAVYVASLNPYLNISASRKCRDSLIISPFVPREYVPTAPVERVVASSRVEPDVAKAIEIVSNIPSELGKAIKVVDSLQRLVDVATSGTYGSYVVYLKQGSST
jgi:hypothetical protein